MSIEGDLLRAVAANPRKRLSCISLRYATGDVYSEQAIEEALDWMKRSGFLGSYVQIVDRPEKIHKATAKLKPKQRGLFEDRP